LLLSACKKDPNNSPIGTISVTIDGVEQSFNTRAIASRSGLHTFTLYGAKGATDSTYVQIQIIYFDQPISVGTYTSTTYTNGVPTPGNFSGNAVIRYHIYPITFDNYYENTYSNLDSDSPSTIIITELTDTNVQGTFSGKLLNNKGVSKTISGKFNLKLLKG
jgi:hypothetical protein